MVNYTNKLVIVILISTSIYISISLADDSEKTNKCQAEYKRCAEINFDELWSKWDYWSAGQLMLSLDEFDSEQLDIIFKIYACDEVANACISNREPNIRRYLEHQQSLPETDWFLSNPEKEGLNNDKLQEAISVASSIPNFRSFLVATNGKLVVEEYYSRKSDPRPQHIQSITKSITSLLIGIAIDKGFIKSEKEVIKPYFPEYFSKPHDERKQNITIEQLLTMTSRLNFVDDPNYSDYKDTKSWGEPGSYREYWRADNFLDLALTYDLVETDDEIAVLYNTPACNLLTTILKRSSDLTSKEFADKYLFGPLGIKNYFWFRDSNHNYVGGHTIYIRPRDLARLGQMIVDGGKFEGRQIVSEQWLEKSFDTFIPEFVNIEDASQVIDYGYLWYTGEYNNYKYQFAWGFGGQFLFLIPGANTLVVTTAFPDTTGLAHWERSQKIINSVMLNVIDALPEFTLN